MVKQKEKEIQKKLREEEKRLLKESAYRRKLKKQREKHKAMKNANGVEYQYYLEYRRMYYKKCKLKIAKDREERLISFLGKRNWRKINVEGKGSYYIVDDGHVYKETGKEIGSVDSNGYVVASTLGFMHRLIWEAFNGKIPEGFQIDHINTIRSDNRLENLRLVTPKENCNNPLTIEHYKQSNKTKAIFKYHNIIQMDLENNVIAKYNTTEDIPSKYYKSAIYGAIKGRLKTAYGCIWMANA